MRIHQSSSPSEIITNISQLSKCTTKAIRQMVLMREQINKLEAANTRLSRRQHTKKKRLQTGGSLTLEASKNLAAQSQGKGKRRRDESKSPGPSTQPEPRRRRYGNYGEIGHNSRTCKKVIEITSSDDYD